MSSQHLNLVGHLTWTDGYMQHAAYVTLPLSDGDLHMTVAVPMLPLGETRVVLVPVATLSGTTVALDLTSWRLYDAETRRNVGLMFTTTDPTARRYVSIAERYVRQARHLGIDELADWGARLVAEMSGQ
ncbi:MAG TPA: hypothetical protein VHX38_00670 [Pseudonocardiaceae bacterium]|jgi:hypothetical protein|nr:hypothetical protein [Pseudonocardiaceae bacterium]